MFAAIYLPRPALQALLIEQSEKRHQPAVVLDEAAKITTAKTDRGKLRVIDRSSEALELGIHRGMTAVQAQARCDFLLLLNRCPKAESQLSTSLLEIAEQFTPDFEATRLGVCLLDLNGVASIETEAREIASEIFETLVNLEYEPQLGLAPNPDLALLAARANQYRTTNNNNSVLVLYQKTMHQILDPLPVQLLDLKPATSELFQLWGIHTIGQFRKLGRNELVERLGTEAGVLWDRACGSSQRLLRLVRPAEDYSAKLELEYQVTTLEPLLFIIRRLLDTITARLQSSYLVAEKLLLTFEFEDGNRYHRRFRIPEPCADVDLLISMLNVHLENFEARAPVCGISLTAIPTRPGKHQFDLFTTGVKDPNRLSETFARVEALLGSERFGVPRMQPTHQPDKFDMRPFNPGQEPEAITSALALTMPRQPSKRLRPRRHILTPPQQSQQSPPQVITSGDFKGRILRTEGPYVISGNWWEKPNYWKRTEWDALHENGNTYRLIQEKGEWFIEAIS